MVLVVDNYDSFTYNLVQYLGELGAELKLVRNDQVSVEEVARMSPKRIVLSPGPCTPKEAGICVELIRRLSGKVPILGVCLGHQCIGDAFGGKVVRAPAPVHGKVSQVFHDGKTLFEGLSLPFLAVRYHSLVVEKESLPSCLEISAWTEDGLIMGLRHRDLPVEGVQFHPESIMTEGGKMLLRNFLEL
ncbi:MAG: anthranilate/aminodeoxychorismate synthase component II [Candidatus Latescibacterota bacterium]|nr:MAG: anthranilate/aminodeoxychorismate synthase component II [Candidatus Latescibacterota bacterium]